MNASLTCRYCLKRGHYEVDCWQKFPEKRPPRARKPKPPTPAQTQQPADDPHGQKRQRVNVLNSQRLWTLSASINGTQMEAILDTGATLTVVSRRHVKDNQIKRGEAIPVQVANGQTAYTLGMATLIVKIGETFLEQPAHVLDTEAIDPVLGLDFLTGNPRCGGILTQPPPERLLFDGQLYPLNRASGEHSCAHLYRIQRIFKKESYTLIPEVKQEAFQKLGMEDNFQIDLFAKPLQPSNQRVLHSRQFKFLLRLGKAIRNRMPMGKSTFQPT